MKLLNTLFAKLTAAFLLLVVLFGAAFLYLSQSMSAMYNQEVMQRLNQSVAMYVAGQQPLIEGNRVNNDAMDQLAARAMILNPSLEIYLIDTEGQILSHRLPDGSVQSSSVEMQPIQTFMTEGLNMPILGTDPRNPNKTNVFSAAPIETNGELEGFVYAVIGGDIYRNIRSSVENSYAMTVSAVLIFSATLIAALIGGALFFYLTRRLSILNNEVTDFGNRWSFESLNGQCDDAQPTPERTPRRDEIEDLETSFRSMSDRIETQFKALESIDKTRRELIANVSHDLRTPLASMQGYIETLIIKNKTLSEAERQQHLEVAYKHSKRLASLVGELFELAKLESSSVEPKIEQFSLLELVHDSIQEFGLYAKTKGISLEIDGLEDCFVSADIALIHRVLQNLLDNALRHTPDGGKVCVTVRKSQKKATVEVSDTGKGIQTHEIPFIFDRFYQSQQQEPSDKIGNGLGLAIVKRILDLHQSRIDVKSQVNKGTSFVFELPQYA